MGDPRATEYLDRTRWQSHPRYPAQTLLLGSHTNFVSINARLIGEAKTVEDPAALEWRYVRWIEAMRSHERYEEYKLYPYLARRWGVSFAGAQEGHRTLHDKHNEVMAAFRGLNDPDRDPTTARAKLVDALAAHHEALVDHLRVEEDAVIPLLLDLIPEEFQHYYHSSIQTLLAELDERAARGDRHDREEHHGQAR
ncbi:MAG: hemerythrin domain-containing protein [Myxococcota bacterium]